MKKITFLSIVVIILVGIFIFAAPVLAATTASLSPANVNAVTGQSFNVSISVNPQGISNYAEKLEIKYPADILEASSFTFGSNWMALTQSGYDSFDNINGVLIKTAGYPAGFTASTTFGTVTFHAKKSGNGAIRIGNNSLAFEANNQSAITGNGTAFSISAKTVAPTKKTTEQVTPAVKIQPEVKTKTDTASTPETMQSASNTQTAAVAEASPASYTWLWILFVIVLLGVIGWRMYKRN